MKYIRNYKSLSDYIEEPPRQRIDLVREVSLVMGEKKVRAKNYYNYPGLIGAWEVRRKKNDGPDKEWLRNLTGNKEGDIRLTGFGWSEMSGYEGYPADYLKWHTNNNPEENVVITEKTYNKVSFEVIKKNPNPNIVALGGSYYNFNIDYELEVESTYEEGNLRLLYLYPVDNEELEDYYYIPIPSNGKTTIPKVGVRYLGIYAVVNNREVGKVSLKLTPLYPGSLCFDGVDDKGTCKIPILSDYTIICQREILEGHKGAVLSKGDGTNQGAFVFEGGSSFSNSTYSFGSGYQFDLWSEGNISFQTRGSYNNKGIMIPGSNPDIETLDLAGFRWGKFALYSLYLFNRTVPDQEIQDFVNNYIDPAYKVPEVPFLILDVGRADVNMIN